PPPAPSPLSLHDALPICAAADQSRAAVAVEGGGGPGDGLLSRRRPPAAGVAAAPASARDGGAAARAQRGAFRAARAAPRPGFAGDRKSTRLNSSHRTISY